MEEKHPRGFTLIEILVALAILGVVLVPLLSLFLQGARANRRAGMKTEAVVIAQGQMEGLKAQGFVAVRAEQGGTLDQRFVSVMLPFPPNHDLHYELELREETVATGVTVELILIEIYVGETGQERELLLTSFLGDR
ncbi:prepilin-type N-terminal cleavage/methylation domain-containing protein [candidate division NPL-UPA2 bacterium]|nr:prepilin-type N-terminal cleavage/methylation domain-containing protein [candidate division NPL-UPA2 bacterium]